MTQHTVTHKMNMEKKIQLLMSNQDIFGGNEGYSLLANELDQCFPPLHAQTQTFNFS